MNRAPISTRFASFAFAAFVTLAIFAGVNTLALSDVPQASAGTLARGAAAAPA